MSRLGRRTAITVVVAAGLVVAGFVVTLVLWATASPPETPGNAVLDFGNDIVLGDYDGAWDRLCAELRADAFDGPGEQFTELQEFRRHVGGVSTNYATEIDGDVAREAITVRPRGEPDDQSNEQWIVHLVKEDGTWRVCGYERAP